MGRLTESAMSEVWRRWLERVRVWWEHDARMAAVATREFIRQEMDTHPAERGEHWR